MQSESNTAIFININGGFDKEYTDVDGIFKDINENRYLVQYSGQQKRTNKDFLLTQGNIWVFYRKNKEYTLLGKVSSIKNIQGRTEDNPIIVQYYINNPIMEVIPYDNDTRHYIYKEGVIQYMKQRYGLSNCMKDFSNGIMKLK